MAAPAQTTPDALDPSAPADPIALAAFVSRRGGRVVAYLDAVTTPERALHAAGEAFATYRQTRAADPAGEADATLLLRAVRRAATANAENPYRPEGRERPARRTRACDAMPRLLVAWTESRLPEGDVHRLIDHLQECPDCRELRDAFDRAEIGYRGGASTELDGTEVGVIAAAMALATTSSPAGGPERSAPRSTTGSRPRRTAIPAPPSSVADHLARPSGPAPVGRRTAIPAPPTAVPPPPTAVPAARGDDAHGTEPPARGTDGASGSDATETTRPRPTALPGAPSARRTGTSAGQPRRLPSDGALEDPLGPEALGYAVPRTGLPRPPRRPAVPRVRRRRQRRPASAVVEASAAADREAPAADPTKPADDATTPVPFDVVATTDLPSAPPEDRVAPPVGSSRAGTGSTAPAAGSGAATAPAADRPAEDATGEVLPATVGEAASDDRGRLTSVGRRALEAPVVRQLGVPAVLLLAVLIAALIAAGAFAGDQGDSVEPVTRPSIQSVPSDPNQIPPLP